MIHIYYAVTQLSYHLRGTGVQWLFQWSFINIILIPREGWFRWVEIWFIFITRLLIYHIRDTVIVPLSFYRYLFSSAPDLFGKTKINLPCLNRQHSVGLWWFMLTLWLLKNGHSWYIVDISLSKRVIIFFNLSIISLKNKEIIVDILPR